MSRDLGKRVHRELTSLGFVLVREHKHRVYRHPLGGPQLVTPKTHGEKRGARNDVQRARRIARELGVIA